MKWVLVLMLALTPALAFDFSDDKPQEPVPIDLPGPLDALVGKLLGFLGSWFGIGGGGIPVSDAGTHTNTGAISISSAGTLAEAKKVVDEFKKANDLAKRMSEMIRGQGMPAQWLPMLIAMAEDMYGLNQDWITLANGGNGNYARSVYPRREITAILNKLPLPAQLRHKLLYAHGELIDGLIERALRDIGGIRANRPSADTVIWNLVGQHFSPDPSYHGTQQSLDRLGIASTTNLQATADLQKMMSAQVELQAVAMQEKRNEMAYAMENEVRRVTEGPVATQQVIGGFWEAYQNFRW